MKLTPFNIIILNVCLVFFLFLILFSCSPSGLEGVDSDGSPLPIGIKKFKDGDVNCWIYEDRSISCVKTTL